MNKVRRRASRARMSSRQGDKSRLAAQAWRSPPPADGPIVMVMFKHCHSAGDARGGVLRRQMRTHTYTHTHTHTRESRPHRRLVIVRSRGGCRCASCSERRHTAPIPLDAVSETYASSSASAPCVTSTPSGDNRRGCVSPHYMVVPGAAGALRPLRRPHKSTQITVSICLG